jgi:hypothetical protein
MVAEQRIEELDALAQMERCIGAIRRRYETCAVMLAEAQRCIGGVN